MAGEKDIDTLIRSLSAELVGGVNVFVTLPKRDIPTGLQPRMVFEESEGSTLILLKEEAEAHGFDFEFPCRMITLKIHSSLEAVGFLARITTALAKHDMGVNPVSGFFHDHLFVPDGREDDAMRVLGELAAAGA